MPIGTPTGIGSVQELGSGASTLALTTSGAAPAGSRVFVVASYFQAGTTFTSCADNGPGLTWTVDNEAPSDADNEMLAFISAPAPAGLASSTIITITVSAAITNVSGSVVAFYCDGVETGASFLNGTPPAFTYAYSPGTTWASPAANTTSNDALVIGASASDGITPQSSSGGNGTEIYDINNATAFQTLVVKYRIETATGAYSVGGTYLTATGEHRLGTVAYKASAEAPAGDTGLAWITA